MFQTTESLSILKAAAFRTISYHSHRNQTHRNLARPINSIGPQNSRGSPSTANSSASNKSLESSQRHRVSAVAINAPFENKEDTELLSEFQEQAELLQYLSSFQGNEENLLDSDLDDLNHKANPPATNPPLFSVYSEGSSKNSVTIHSTKRRLANSKSTKNRQKALSNSKLSSPSDSSSQRIIPVDPRDSINGDELAADAEFVMALRAYLRANRKARRARTQTSYATLPNVVSLFISSMGNVPVLSPKQEKYLARVIARGNKVRNAAASLARSSGVRPSLSAVAEAAGLSSPQHAAKAVLLAEDARALMVEFNIRFVVSVAKRYVGNGMDLSDLIQEGMFGLEKAIDKFDHAKGFKFSTYAHWWIRQAVSRAISDQGRDIRLPVHVVEFLARLKKVTDGLKAQPNRTTPPSYKEIAAAMGVPLRRFVTIMQSIRDLKSPEELSMASSSAVKELGRETSNFMDSISECDDDLDRAGDNPFAENEKMEYFQETFALVLSTLPVRERNIIRLRYGLNPLAQAEAIDALISTMSANSITKKSGSNSAKDASRSIAGQKVAANKKGGRSAKARAVPVKGSKVGEAMQQQNGAAAAELFDATDASSTYNNGSPYFGDEDGDPMTGLGLEQVGIIHRLSRERIRQIEADAIRHLRMPWRVSLLNKVKAGIPLSQDTVDRLVQASDAQNTWY